jgi:NAD+ dependent glucose-6-phosphate dehydrogenase
VSEQRRNVLVTGSSGLIGGVLADQLADRYALRGFDRRPGPIPGPVGELADPEALGTACRGVEAIVHLAGDSRFGAPWASVLRDNIAGTAAVFEAALNEGVERVVYASSNRVMGQVEIDEGPGIYDGFQRRIVGADETFRPDSLYAVSKAFGEVLGRYYSDCHGLRVVCLRLGSVVPEDDLWLEAQRRPGEPTENHRRLLATWLSQRDCAELIASALEADVRFAVAFGVSANARRFWDLEPARRLLGFEPVDEARDESTEHR